jgi:signal transduction histidine kinase
MRSPIIRSVGIHTILALTLPILLIAGWAFWWTFNFSQNGISWLSSPDKVARSDISEPESRHFQKDQSLSDFATIDPARVLILSVENQDRDKAIYSIERQADHEYFILQLSAPQPAILLNRFVQLLIASLVLGIGITIYLINFKKSKSQVSFLICHIGSLLVVTGAASLLTNLLPKTITAWTLDTEGVLSILLMAIPFSYGYTFSHTKLLSVDHLSHSRLAGAARYIPYLAVYLAVYAVLFHNLQIELWKEPAITLGMILFLAATMIVAFQVFTRVMNFLLFRGWHDYHIAMKKIGEKLEQKSDLTTKTNLLIQELQKAMQIKCVCLWVSIGEEIHYAQSKNCCVQCLKEAGYSDAALNYLLGNVFAENNTQPFEETFFKILSDPTLSSLNMGSDGGWSTSHPDRLYFPMQAGESLRGLLVLGPKNNGELYSQSDIDVLGVIARQVSTTLENAHLIAELEQRSLDHARLHRQLLFVRELERKRLARELHDQIVQLLVGLGFGLSKIKRNADGGLREEIDQLQSNLHEILVEARNVCSDLRPTVLDSQGFVPAIRSLLREVNSKSSFDLRLEIEGDTEQALPEEIALCIYRALQEGLLNIQKHASARQVNITILLSQNHTSFILEDDGKGFILPSRLGDLTVAGHFGLVGLVERVELIGGKVKIITSPGNGCQITVDIPVSQKYLTTSTN